MAGIGRLFLVLMVAAFILVDLVRIQDFLRSLVPEQYQVDYERIASGIDRGLSGVIRGQLVICCINGAFTYTGLCIFHVKYPLLLAGIAATMSLVPIFGSILSSVPIVAIALISSGTFDLRQGMLVLAWIIGIHLLEANFLNPKIMGDAAKIHPVLVVFALIAGEHSYGIVGALFAVPVASIIQTIFMYYRKRPRPPTSVVRSFLRRAYVRRSQPALRAAEPGARDPARRSAPSDRGPRASRPAWPRRGPPRRPAPAAPRAGRGVRCGRRRAWPGRPGSR